MKTYELDQIKRDESPQINLLEDQLQLSTDNIWKIFNDKIITEKKKSVRKRGFSFAVAVCAMLIIAFNWQGIYTIAAGFFTKDTAKIQDFELPDVKMELITVNKPEKLDHYGVYSGTKYYTSLKDCTDELGIHVLTSDLAYNEKYEEKISLLYPLDGDEKFGMNLVSIYDNMYIIGDLKDFERQGTGAFYKGPQSEDDKYNSPVSLRLEFYITGTKKKINEANADYSGLAYAYHEKFKGSNGIEAQIIGKNSARLNNYTAIFYKDNIKYILEGTIELSELKKIIESFR